MKYFLILLLSINLFISCTKPHVTIPTSITDTTSSAYLIVNDTMHLCNYISANKISGNSTMGYEILLDSTDVSGYPYYYSLDIQCSDTSLTNAGSVSMSFQNWFISPHTSVGQKSSSFTITKNSNGKISGYFSCLFIFNIFTNPYSYTTENEIVTGVFNNVKIL